MTLKIILTILAFANGAFMLMDGIHVLRKGKYIGPEKPGAWANIFYKLNINVFKLGPLFVVFGLVWLFWAFALWNNPDWSFIFGITISILTLWYIKVGTIISIITLILLYLL